MSKPQGFRIKVFGGGSRDFLQDFLMSKLVLGVPKEFMRPPSEKGWLIFNGEELFQGSGPHMVSYPAWCRELPEKTLSQIVRMYDED